MSHDVNIELFVGQNVTLDYSIVDEAGAAVDLTGATIALVFKRETDATKTPVVPTVISAPGGTIQYKTLTSDLDVKGHWKVQVTVTAGDGSVYPATIQEFDVIDGL